MCRSTMSSGRVVTTTAICCVLVSSCTSVDAELVEVSGFTEASGHWKVRVRFVSTELLAHLASGSLQFRAVFDDPCETYALGQVYIDVEDSRWAGHTDFLEGSALPYVGTLAGVFRGQSGCRGTELSLAEFVRNGSYSHVRMQVVSVGAMVMVTMQSDEMRMSRTEFVEAAKPPM